MNVTLSTIDRMFAWLLQSSGEAAALALVVFGIQMLFRRQLPARWRYALWLVVVVRLCLPALLPRPFVTPRLSPTASMPTAAAPAPLPLLWNFPEGVLSIAQPAAASTVTSGSAPRVSAISRGLQGLSDHRILPLVWGLGALAFSIATLLQMRRLAKTLRAAQPCEDRPVLELLDDCAVELRLRRRIRLVATPVAHGPAIVGHFRPTLLLPVDFTTQYSREELRVVFLHELAHLRRGDLLVNALLTGLQILHWFNPVLWWAFARLRQDRELATDALVLSGPRAAALQSLYARTLLKLVEGCAGAPLCPQALGMMETNAHLKDRLTRITQATPGAYRLSLPGLLLLGVLGLTALTQETPRPATTFSGQTKEQLAAAQAEKPEASPGAPIDDDSSMVSKWEIAGTRLTPEAVAVLEKEVAANPDNFAARVKILGYHFTRRAMEADSRAASQPHLLWIIRNKPTSTAVGSPLGYVMEISDPERYAEVKQAWEEQLARNPNVPVILINAAGFFLLNDINRAEELMRSALALEPKNTRWAERLGHLLSIKAMRADETTAAKAHRDSFQAFQQALEGKKGVARFYGLGETTLAALRAGDTKQARTYAQELLDTAPLFKSDWNYGNAIYIGNTTLGALSLNEKDLAAARTYLLAAGDTPGSPQLNSFGPDLTLAKALLDSGENETVAAFLGKIGKFWKGHTEQVEGWQKAVLSGEKPDLGIR